MVAEVPINSRRPPSDPQIREKERPSPAFTRLSFWLVALNLLDEPLRVGRYSYTRDHA
jgi:hypothetical protein